MDKSKEWICMKSRQEFSCSCFETPCDFLHWVWGFSQEAVIRIELLLHRWDWFIFCSGRPHKEEDGSEEICLRKNSKQESCELRSGLLHHIKRLEKTSRMSRQQSHQRWTCDAFNMVEFYFLLVEWLSLNWKVRGLIPVVRHYTCSAGFLKVSLEVWLQTVR